MNFILRSFHFWLLSFLWVSHKSYQLLWCKSLIYIFPLLQLWMKLANICHYETSRNGLRFLILSLTPIQARVTGVCAPLSVQGLFTITFLPDEKWFELPESRLSWANPHRTGEENSLLEYFRLVQTRARQSSIHPSTYQSIRAINVRYVISVSYFHIKLWYTSTRCFSRSLFHAFETKYVSICHPCLETLRNHSGRSWVIFSAVVRFMTGISNHVANLSDSSKLINGEWAQLWEELFCPL